MALPYPIDPSLPANPSPLFSDSTAARGDHLRANNAEIWANFNYIVDTILGSAVISTDGTFAANSDLKLPTEKAILTYLNSLIPAGSMLDYAGITIPTGWLKADGSNLVRANYTTLFGNISAVVGTVTISIATPGVVTKSSHPFQTGDCIHLTTTGALPTGLSASTNYYVIYNDINSFWLATTYANAINGTKINTSGSQSGDHTITWIPWGAADSTHFYLPDIQGITTEGSGQLTTNGAVWGGVNYLGRLGQYKQDTMQGHMHDVGTYVSVGGDLNITYGSLSAADGVFKRSTVPVTDGTNGTPRTGLITAGPRVGVYKIIKVI